ncbi:hypothetical protein ACFQ4X_07005 [Fictibacillus halophilus]|uniref:hypothetical protein n=1 Tax=Fictibacillus halophilus TaxID=1610490 RepID=UPI0036269C30
MALPLMSQYSEAIQNPGLNLLDPDLRLSKPDLNPMGLPKVVGGGFALTYRLKNNNKSFAVRCFHKEALDLQDRYMKISQFLRHQRNTFFVDFEYQHKGIIVNNNTYPIIKMDWLEGKPLYFFIEENLRNAKVLKDIQNQLIDCVNQLISIGIAHGDLQHDNIFVSGNKLKLIDYDGLYVPGMKYGSSNELGHVNYAHPDRNPLSDVSISDRFPSIVIYLALEALQHSPSLWSSFDNGQNLLFRTDDFVNPESSKLLFEMSKLPNMNALVKNFTLLCNSSYENIPTLKDFINGNILTTQRTITKVNKSTIRVRQYKVLNAKDKNELMEHVGQVIEVIGFVKEIKILKTRYGQPYARINFEEYNPRTKKFNLVIWNNGLKALENKGINISSFKNKWISVVSLVSEYRKTPQFIIDPNTKINILKSEQEAMSILNSSMQISSNNKHSSESRNSSILKVLKQSKSVIPNNRQSKIITSNNQAILNNLKNNTQINTVKNFRSTTNNPPNHQNENILFKLLKKLVSLFN